MKIKSSHILSTAAALLLGATFPVSAAPKIGEAAPGFTLTDATGKAHSLADFKGKFVVLEWLNHGCPFVKKHYDGGNMQALQKEFTGKDVVWLSICSSAEGKQGHMTPEQAVEIAKEKGAAPTAVLLDGDGKVGRLYDAKVTPHMFVINPDGLLVYNGAIDSIKSTDSKDVAKATNHVRAALEEAMQGKPVSITTTTPYGCSVKY